MIFKYRPRFTPERLRLVNPAPGVFRIVQAKWSEQPPKSRGMAPRGKLKTTPEVKARVRHQGSASAGYRPSLLQAVKDGGDQFPVESDVALQWLVPAEPPGRLHGLSAITAPMSVGRWSDDDTESADGTGDHDAPNMGADHLRPRSGPVQDLHVNGHGFRVFASDDPRFPCCRVCSAPIRTEPVPAVCDFACKGCWSVLDDDDRTDIRVCLHDCPTDLNHDQCGCNAHLTAYKRSKPRVTCSDRCFKVYDSRRHHVSRPDAVSVERVRALRRLDDITIATMLGLSQQKVRKICDNLPEYSE